MIILHVLPNVLIEKVTEIPPEENLHLPRLEEVTGLPVHIREEVLVNAQAVIQEEIAAVRTLIHRGEAALEVIRPAEAVRAVIPAAEAVQEVMAEAVLLPEAAVLHLIHEEDKIRMKILPV